ncbi:MAG: type III pantothenate kinase [Planctomycetota bacterium]
MTRDAVLTVDLGNTGGSLATTDATDAPRALARWRAAEEIEALEEALGALSSASSPRALAAISAVGSSERERAVIDVLERLGHEVVPHPEPGLEFRIERPETCGWDRKYAARAAVDAAGSASSLLVVDAGTALTVDAVLAGPRSFLGGAIALGPKALAGALSTAGARLPSFSVDVDVPALGRSTNGALRAGVVVGFRGAVRELCAAIAAEAFGSCDGVRALLTGGARDYARAAVVELFDDVHEDALLVHRGLAAATRDARRG